MKRLFKIGGGLFIYSIVPIASWLVLALVLNDSRISHVFSITYALQFVWAVIKSFFATGANIRGEKEKNKNSVGSSILFGTISSLIIFSIPLIFVDRYIDFFNLDVEFYRIYVIYSIIQLFLQSLFTLIIEKLYFEDKEKEANIHLFCFNIINFAVLILSALIFNKTWIALMITLIVLLCYVVFLYITQINKFKIDFAIYKNFKYESANIISNIFMLLIYLFGFKIAFSAGSEYLAALNLVGLCTDTQWDTLYAVDIVAKVDISKNRMKYKKLIKESYLFCFVIILSSIIMVFSLFSIYHVMLKIALVYLIFQIADMLLHPYKAIVSIFVQIEYSPSLNTIISLAMKVIRFVISIAILSPYCTEIGQIVAGILAFSIYLFIRIWKLKTNGNKLTIKNSLQSDKFVDLITKQKD